MNPFTQLGLPSRPVILAPLAGVSDHPFRRMCQFYGADLTYVEMISATALNCGSKKTIEMLSRHEDEKILGVQVTSKTPEEMEKAVLILNDYPFDTIDINMGCPVRKVVGTGCGSAILKDPERVYKTTLAASQSTNRPVSVKIRLGWDHSSLNFLEVADAAQSGGAKWLTIHGRTRSDNYGDPVDLEKISVLKKHLRIPVIGNGNLFSHEDCRLMKESSKVDGFMISRGALGNPWIFREIKNGIKEVSLDEWFEAVNKHISFQEHTYGNRGIGSICMRKHILWYVSGWPHARKIRENIAHIGSLKEYRVLLTEYFEKLQSMDEEVKFRDHGKGPQNNRFIWNPVFDMDRSHDRGVGEDGIKII